MNPIGHVVATTRLLLGTGSVLLFSFVAISPAEAQTCVQPPSGLVSWWPGDGNASDIKDGNHGTLVSGATFAPGLVGQAFRFTGSLNSGVRVPSSANLNPADAITLDAWIFPFSFPNTAPSILRRQGSSPTVNNYLIAAGSGAASGVAHCNIGDFANPVGGTIPLNQWTHVACTYDRQFARLYVNGVEVAAQPRTQPIPASSRDLWIGNWEFQSGRQFNGLIDEVEVLNRALTAEEVEAIHAAGAAGKCKACLPPPSALVSWWPADGNAEDIVDSNDGSLQPGATFAPGLIGQAFAFDGVAGAVRAPEAGASLDGFGQLTVDAWIRATRLASGQVSEGIVTKYDTTRVDGVSYYFTEVDGGYLRVAVFHTNTAFAFYTSNARVIPLNTFTHVAGVWEGGFTQTRFHLYINGIEVPGTLTVVGAPTGMAQNTTPVNIGRFESATSTGGQPFGHFQGLIDEVEIFNRALAATEIQAMFNSGAAGKCKAPEAEAGPDQAVEEGAIVTLDGSHSSGLDLSYLWEQIAGPAVVLIGETTTSPSFGAPPLSGGVGGNQTLTFKLTVTAGSGISDSDTVDVTVKNVNHAPVADAGPDQTVNESSAVVLSATSSYDPDGDAIGCEWVQTCGSPVTLDDETSCEPSFTAPLVPGGVGGSETLCFEVSVSDTTLSATDAVQVTVEQVNHAPVANAGPDQTRFEGSVVILDGTASSDPDGDPFTCSWTQVSGPTVVLSDPAVCAPSFTAPDVDPGGDTLVLRLVVTDSQLPSLPDDVTTTIQNLNDPPACALAQPSLPSLWPPNHKLVSVGITGVTDPENNQVTIAITGVTQDEPVSGLGDGDTSPDAVLQGTTVLLRAERSGTGNGRVYHVQFTADDGQGGTCSGAVTVGVPRSMQSGTPIVDGPLHDSTQP